MNKFFIRCGIVLGFLGVLLGAFGAHTLKANLTAAGNFDTFETAVRYQFYGSFTLIVTGILAEKFQNRYINITGYLFLIGTIIFSLSLYLICFTGVKTFGAIAPIGGVCLLAAWGSLFLSISKR